MTDAHVIQRGEPASRPSYPRKPLVFAISLALGALAGDRRRDAPRVMDRVFRTVEQVRDELGVEALGCCRFSQGHRSCNQESKPENNPKRWDRPRLARISGQHRADHALFDRSSFFVHLRKLCGQPKWPPIWHYRDRLAKIIGVVSLLPKEGKSTVAKNFASLLSREGARTLLIDADTRNPALTRAIGCERRQGLAKRCFLPPRSGRTPQVRAG